MERLLTKLVSFKTVVGKNPEEFEKALTWIENQIKDSGLYIRRVINKVQINDSNYQEFTSLIATTQNTDKPKVWLNAHLDVVDAENEDLFTTKRIDNYLYGRGTIDMKFAIACYIKLIQEIKESLKKLDLGIMLVPDEEHGGFNGTGFLIKNGYASKNSCKVAFIPDGGLNWTIVNKSKGVFQFKAIATGDSGHSSSPWECKTENCNGRMVCFLAEIYNKYNGEARCIDNKHYHNTINISTVGGGKRLNIDGDPECNTDGIPTNIVENPLNQIPEYADATIDIRFIPKLTKEEISRNIKEIASKYNINIIEIASGLPCNINTSQVKEIAIFKKIAKEEYNITLKEELTHGSSDARFFNELQIPILQLFPKGGGLHSNNEYIDLEDLNRFYNVMKKWIIEIAKKD